MVAGALLTTRALSAIWTTCTEETAARRHRLLLVVATLLAVVTLTGCGKGEGDVRTELDYETYFALSSFEYDPAASLTELSDRSTIVTTATLTDVIDGPIFGERADDQAASRFALFEFTSDSLQDPLYVRLSRPNTSDIDQLRSAMPIGADAVLYLRPLPDIPPEEQDLWFNVTPDRQLWVPTTPQGLILDLPDDGTIDRVDVPIEHETGELIEQPEDGAPLGQWLPPTGEKLPSNLAP